MVLRLLSAGFPASTFLEFEWRKKGFSVNIFGHFQGVQVKGIGRRSSRKQSENYIFLSPYCFFVTFQLFDVYLSIFPVREVDV